jgi:hypothetical protein
VRDGAAAFAVSGLQTKCVLEQGVRDMKTIMRALTLAAVLLTGAATQAEIVVDQFDTGPDVQTTVGSVGVASGNRFFNRSTAIVTTEKMNQVIPTPTPVEATLRFGTAAANRFGKFDYAFGVNTKDFHSAGNSNLLKFNYNALGTYTVVVTAADLDGNTASYSVAGISGAGTFAVNGTQFGNGAVVSKTNSLTVEVFETSDLANRTFQFTSAITAVPEPATMSLLGLTAIGGIFAHRRRKNQLAA